MILLPLFKKMFGLLGHGYLKYLDMNEKKIFDSSVPKWADVILHQ